MYSTRSLISHIPLSHCGYSMKMLFDSRNENPINNAYLLQTYFPIINKCFNCVFGLTILTIPLNACGLSVSILQCFLPGTGKIWWIWGRWHLSNLNKMTKHEFCACSLACAPRIRWHWAHTFPLTTVFSQQIQYTWEFPAGGQRKRLVTTDFRQCVVKIAMG